MANGTTKDVLYEGQSQTSDLPSSGNPVTYYNGKDYTFTWTKGRQLASATVDGKQVSYTYDMSGVRTSKTVNGTTYNYTTLSGKVMRQTWGNKSLEFVYDDGNQPFAMIYNDGSTSTLYYYVLNAQGDVIALLNSAGALVASYNYGAWGNYSVHGAVFRNTPDVARRIVGIEEGRLAAVLLRHQLALRVVGILLQLRRLGHARARSDDPGDVAGCVVGIREAAAA